MDNSSTGIIVAAIIVAAVISIALYLWLAVALGAVFAKLGEPRWKAWVPIVNSVTIFQLGGYSGLWVIAQLLPVVNIVATVIMILALLTINRRFGRGGGFTVLAVFALPIWASIIGFGRAQALVPTESSDQRDDAPFVPSLPPVTWGGPPTRLAGGAESAPTSSAPVAPSFFVEPPAAGTAPNASADAEYAEFTFDFTPLPPAPPIYLPVSEQPPAVPMASPVSSEASLFTEPAPSLIPMPPASLTPPDDAVAPAAPITQSLWASPPADTAAAIWTDRADSTVADGSTVITGRAPAFDDAENDFDATVISSRRVQPCVFETDEGQRVILTHPVVLLGRNPSRGRTHPDAQLVEVVDPGKTVSKTHARLELVDGAWIITDLHSTNGVVLTGAGGLETELDPGASGAVSADFLLGELSARIYQER